MQPQECGEKIYERQVINPMDQTEISAEYDDGVLTVRIEGEVDHHAARHLREDIDKKIFFHRPAVLVLDLSRVGFMDSSGLGLMLGRYTRMEEIGGRLVISDPSQQTEKIIRLSGLDKKIEIKKKGGQA